MLHKNLLAFGTLYRLVVLRKWDNDLVNFSAMYATVIL